MPSLSDIVSITITTATAAVTQAGFGTPLITGPNAAFAERARSYTSLTALAADFPATTGEYQCANAVFAQSPTVQKVIVGRFADKPTQRWAVTPVAANLTVYKLKIGAANGTVSEVSYTSDGTATVTEIISGLKTAIDLLGLAVTVSDQTTFMRIVANVAGAWFTVESTTSPISNLLVEQDHATANVSTNLDAIKNENNEWYCILHSFNSTADIAAISTWAEANTKLFMATDQNTRIITVATGSDSTTSAAVAKAAAMNRTSIWYHPSTAGFVAAALAGKCLPLQPGEETWRFKTLSGPTAVVLTDTHITNLEAKNCGYYQNMAGVNVTAEGKVSSGTFIDIIRGRDWLQARMQERIYSRLVNAKKIPYTDAGIAVIEAEVRAQLADGVAVGLLSDNPAPTVQVPKASSVSSIDKAARVLNNVKFDAVLAGAIHKVSISGTIAV